LFYVKADRIELITENTDFVLYADPLAHELLRGDIVRQNELNKFVHSQSDTLINAVAQGIVYEVISAKVCWISTKPVKMKTVYIKNLIANEAHFLSNTVPGDYMHNTFATLPGAAILVPILTSFADRSIFFTPAIGYCTVEQIRD